MHQQLRVRAGLDVLAAAVRRGGVLSGRLLAAVLRLRSAIPKFPAPVALGADCSHAPCVPPAVCQGGATCVIPPSEGETCDPSAQVPCRTLDDYCNVTTMVCTKALQTGDACGDATAAAGVNPCIGADSCSATFAGIAVCQPNAGLGDSCPSGGGCQDGLDCDSTAGQCLSPIAGADCGAT